MAKYPLVAQSDCTADVKQEVIDIAVTAVRARRNVGCCTAAGRAGCPAVAACSLRRSSLRSTLLHVSSLRSSLPQVERHAADMEKCTQAIKEGLDRRFGGPWHVVVGKAFAFEVTFEVRLCRSALQGRASGAHILLASVRLCGLGLH